MARRREGRALVLRSISTGWAWWCLLAYIPTLAPGVLDLPVLCVGADGHVSPECHRTSPCPSSSSPSSWDEVTGTEHVAELDSHISGCGSCTDVSVFLDQSPARNSTAPPQVQAALLQVLPCPIPVDWKGDPPSTRPPPVPDPTLTFLHTVVLQV